MDEEDLAELRESRKLVDENEEMDFGGTEAEMRRREGVDADDEYVLRPAHTYLHSYVHSSMANALATALAPTPQDSVGARILRKMGWRVGQGVGPRLTWDQRRVQDRNASQRITQSPGEADDDEARKHMYPRRDTPLLVVQRKDNAHGLGYVPGLGLNASVGAESSSARKGPQISGACYQRLYMPESDCVTAGFGLGALNDADDDDLDVYDTSMRPRAGGRVAFEVTDEDEQITIGTFRRVHQNQGGVSLPQSFSSLAKLM